MLAVTDDNAPMSNHQSRNSTAAPSRWLAGSDTSLERELAFATLVGACAVGIGALAERLLAFDDLSLVFMTSVIVVAVRSRMGVAVYSAMLGFLAYNYFFIEPRFTFYITARHGTATVGLFLVAALVCGRLANRLRSQMLLVEAARARAETRRDLARRLAATSNEAEARATANAALREAFDGEGIVYLVDEERLTPADTAEGQRFDPSLDAAARSCWLAAGRGQYDVVADASRSWACWPLLASGQVLGVLALRLPGDEVLSPEGSVLAESIAGDLAQALARMRLAKALHQAQVQAEAERLRAALLTSVSHDLRSPLSTIIGSAESLELYRDQLGKSDQAALAHDIAQEGRRLDRYIQNLLDMARLEQNAAFAREWVGVDEIVGSAARRLLKAYPGQRLLLKHDEALPLIRINAPLFEQALFNVLDNAARHSPADAPVEVRASADGDRVSVDVIDRGPGIPEDERTRVFEMFHRVEQGDRNPDGTGLGLAICRGILRAHGGEVSALSGVDDIGTTIRLSLPIEPLPAGSMPED